VGNVSHEKAERIRQHVLDCSIRRFTSQETAEYLSSCTTASGPNMTPPGPSGTAPSLTNPAAPSPGQEITPPGPPATTGPPAPTVPVTPPVAPLVEPITCKPDEILQDGKCVPKPTTTCKPDEILQDGKCTSPPVCINVPGQVAKCPPPPPPVCKYPYHRVGNHCELDKNCHYDKDRLGRSPET
jgi:hypothetical protein